jgi:hypothetical protein
MGIDTDKIGASRAVPGQPRNKCEGSSRVRFEAGPRDTCTQEQSCARGSRRRGARRDLVNIYIYSSIRRSLGRSVALMASFELCRSCLEYQRTGTWVVGTVGTVEASLVLLLHQISSRIESCIFVSGYSLSEHAFDDLIVVLTPDGV